MTTVRTQIAVTNGEVTYARDFDGTDTVTMPAELTRELRAEIKRLRAKLAAAEKIFDHALEAS